MVGSGKKWKWKTLWMPVAGCGFALFPDVDVDLGQLWLTVFDEKDLTLNLSHQESPLFVFLVFDSWNDDHLCHGFPWMLTLFCWGARLAADCLADRRCRSS